MADTRSTISLRIDPGILARIDERASTLGLERSTAIERFLDEVLGRLSIREREDALYAIDSKT